MIPSSGFCKRLLAVVTGATLVLLASSQARAATPEAYRVRASITRDEGRVRGHLDATVRLAPGETEVRLWLYPDRLAVPPSTMDERSWRWIYPGEIDRGGITVDAITVDGAPAGSRREHAAVGAPRGRDFAGSDLFVEVAPSDEARTVRLALDFEVVVPGRFGRMGRDDGRLALEAPWYPLVVGEGDAFEHDVPHELDVSLDDGALAVGDARFARHARITRRGAYVPVLAAPALHDHVVEVEGVQIVLRSPTRMYVPPPPSVRGEEGMVDLSRVDVVAYVREVARQVVVSARAFGVPVPDRIVLMEMPSRTELCATAPGVVLFSDHLFQIFPLDQTLDFHRRALRRALFGYLAAPLAADDPPADRGWATDLRAVALVDLDEARRHHGAETPMELLSLLSFHPAVDQLLYAPQIAFEDAYFAVIEERDPYRDDPVRSRRPLSRGRRILESARDVMDEDALRRFVAMLVNGERSAREALAAAAPARADRLESWLAATGLAVNYRLGEIHSERDGDEWQHTIVVHRDGADRVEPVEVRVDDDQGHHVTEVWDGPGATHEIVVRTPGRLAGVTIDPRFRLPESPALADGHPRMDDATDLPWRPPILNGVLFNVLVSEGDFTGLLDFVLRRRYDLEHGIGLRAERTRAFTGGMLRYEHGIGDKAHTNRRIGRLSATLSFVRLHEFFGDADLGGWRTQLELLASVNTVRFALDPREGLWGAASVTGGVAVRDDGSLGWTFRGGARGGIAIPVSLVNTLVFVVGGGFTLGDALASELQGLGGSTRLRGFESGELLGRGVVYGVAEWRWSAFRDLAINLAHLIWVREIQLAAFAGVGAIFDRTEATTGRHDDALGAADVGGGVRIHYEYGGVQPGVLSLDLGVPLTRGLIAQPGDPVRNPVAFYVGFDQYF
ncbi:MAG: hypothetical protein KC619_08340 [Myxococcales bacterium]|nr:hypothetical protein [Myxococcales bacterium]